MTDSFVKQPVCVFTNLFIYFTYYLFLIIVINIIISFSFLLFCLLSKLLVIY